MSTTAIFRNSDFWTPPTQSPESESEFSRMGDFASLRSPMRPNHRMPSAFWKWELYTLRPLSKSAHRSAIIRITVYWAILMGVIPRISACKVAIFPNSRRAYRAVRCLSDARPVFRRRAIGVLTDVLPPLSGLRRRKYPPFRPPTFDSATRNFHLRLQYGAISFLRIPGASRFQRRPASPFQIP